MTPDCLWHLSVPISSLWLFFKSGKKQQRQKTQRKAANAIQSQAIIIAGIFTING
jgi:hypothetical protein